MNESDIAYYYVMTNNPYKIETTDFLGELIEMLYSGDAEFISDDQRITLKLPKNYFDFLKKEISAYQEKVPLYDISFNHIYLIFKENVYRNIHLFNYRFIDENFYQDLLQLTDPSDIDKDNLRILSHYDFDVLKKTYVDIFYSSYVLDNYITTCRRPSYASKMEHISPYYSTTELYYLAYDWNLTEKSVLTQEEENQLCRIISQYDIPAQTLLDHQMYIYDERAIGLVKYYSLFGSYFMNLYLRKYRCCIVGEKHNYENVIRNLDLENQIRIMTNLVRKAPPFIKDHTVYRFVEKDDYLKYLKIGDVYTDPSFMSTTRNPFYYQENYAFGYILLKIKLPGNIRGIGLSIEAYSNFPKEEEIILPPTSRFRLDNVIEGSEIKQYHHVLNKKIMRKYEFTWIGNDFVNNDKEFIIKMPGAYEPVIREINFLDLLRDENIKDMSISDRLRYFRETYINNMNNQFISIIGGNRYTFNMGSYDASSVYKQFFYYEVSDGIMITSANPKYGNINILMEMGTEIHVNYYFKFSLTDTSSLVDLNRADWIQWLSLLAYAVGSRSIVIHSNYIFLHYNKTDTNEMKQMKTRYTFSQNIYQYLKNKKKMYQEFDEITPDFDYEQLDLLETKLVADFVKPSDKDELYRIAQTSGATNMRELYLYIVEKFPKLLLVYEEKMELIYLPDVNPFKHISYTLDPWVYLLNKGLIHYVPTEKEFTIKKGSFKKLIGEKKIPKFKNRLRLYLINQP